MPTGQAEIWEEPLTIPTYRVGPPETAPLFYAGRGYQGAKGPVYPYPMLDGLTDDRQDKTYKAVYLENPYLRLCVLPELGGRIFTGTDKTNGYEFIYRQHVVKPALIGMLGAWISGGVEWNIPHHHRPTTFMPLDYCLAASPNGARTLWLGEIELRHRLKWLVGLTLYPDRSYLQVDFRIFNRTPYVHSFLCFTNLAVHANEDYQVIFPPGTRFGTQHAKCEFIRWPVADSIYAGVDYTAGVDVSRWKNHPAPLSIFAWNYRDDFFGGYDHGRQAGIVHVADHRAVPGKKFFTFANGPAGRMWDKILTDSDGPYIELMAGAYSDNQPDYSWIQPYETKTVTEYWYPIRALGGIANANRDAAVNLHVNGRTARVAFNATNGLAGATVIVQGGGKTLLRRPVDIGPDRPFVRQLPLARGTGQRLLTARLMSASGEEIISCRAEVCPTSSSACDFGLAFGQPDAASESQSANRQSKTKTAPAPFSDWPRPVAPPPPPRQLKSNEELYLAGLRLEQFRSPALEPEPYYRQLLRRDPGDARANTALGILCLKHGLYAEAQKHFETAVGRLAANYTSPKDGEALYYLGVALAAQDRAAEARAALGKACWSFAWRAAGYYALAELACRQANWTEALAQVEQSIACNALNAKALNLKAMVLRKLDRAQEALDAFSRTPLLDPLDFRARNERLLAKAALGRKDAAQEKDDLFNLMRGAAQSYLELACDYEACGRWDEAIDVLSRLAPAGGNSSAADPMVHYALGYYRLRKGDAAEARRHFDLAAKLPPDCCFPSRFESARWLSAALERNPADARAHYYLGNLLYDHQPEKAVRSWERSARLDGSFWTVHRNLALAYARFDKHPRRALAAMKKALRCKSDQPRLYTEQDQLLAAAGAPHRRRLAILEANGDVVARRDDSLLRRIVLNILVGQYDRAIELLDGHHFHIWEGGENSVHNVHVDAHLLKGRRLLAQGRARQALTEFNLAAEYPDRFEVGRPHDGGRAAEVYYFMGMAQQALGDAPAARAAFEDSAVKAKKGTHLPYYRGLALAKLGRRKEARACFAELTDQARQMLSIKPGEDFFEKFGSRQADSVQKAQGHYLLGLGLLGRGRRAGAVREFRAALRLNGNHLGAKVMLEGA